MAGETAQGGESGAAPTEGAASQQTGGQGSGSGQAPAPAAPAAPAAPKQDTSAELDLIKRDLNEFKTRSTNYEKQLAEYQKTVQDLTEKNTSLMKERGEKGGEKERQEYEEHLRQQYDKRYGAKFSEFERHIADRDKTLGDKDKIIAAQIAELDGFRVMVPAMQLAMDIFSKESLPIVQKEIESVLFWQDGETRVKGPDGKALHSEDNPQNYMGAQEYLRKYARQFPQLCPAQQIQGTKETGTSSSRPAGSNGLPANWNQMESPEKRDFLVKNPEIRKTMLQG